MKKELTNFAEAAKQNMNSLLRRPEDVYPLDEKLKQITEIYEHAAECHRTLIIEKEERAKRNGH
jgi:hypothetical protein